MYYSWDESVSGGEDLGQWAEASSAAAGFFSKLFGGKKKAKGPLNEKTYGSLPPPYQGDVPDISGSFTIPPAEGPYGGTIDQDGPLLLFHFQRNVTGGTVSDSQAVFTGPNVIAAQSTNGIATGTLSGNTITWSSGVHYYLSQEPTNIAVRLTATPPSEGGLQIFKVPGAKGMVASAKTDYTPLLIGGGILLAGIFLLKR